jgi:UMF1 family MFS transporter
LGEENDNTDGRDSATRSSALAIGSWALYDFANTIFSAVCVTLFFPPYLYRISGKAVNIGTANIISMIAAGIVLPVAGAVIDRTGRAKPWLFWLTVVCCAATALLSAFAPPCEPGGIRVFILYLMAMFVVANFAYQVSLVFYNSLITSVAPKDKVGFVSGLGVGLGYAGIVFALFVIMAVIQAWGWRYAFAAAAVLFFITALPLFLFVKERKVAVPERLRLRTAWEALKRVWRTDRSLKKRKGLLCFFLGNFLVVDALNTAIVYFAVYIENVFGRSLEDIVPYLVAFYTGALVWGIIQGKACDRFGAKPVYLLSAGMLALSVILYSILRSETLFFGVLIVGGSFALAGVWTAGRKMLVELSPPEELGEFFGLYGMTGRLSAYGTIFFGLLADHAGFRLALLALLATSVPGLVLLAFARKEPLQGAQEVPQKNLQ